MSTLTTQQIHELVQSKGMKKIAPDLYAAAREAAEAAAQKKADETRTGNIEF